MSVTGKSLSEFLEWKEPAGTAPATAGEVESPRGEVYLWRDVPFAQLHLFPDEYSFFWLGQASAERLLEGMRAFIVFVIGDLTSLGYGSPRHGQIALTKTTRSAEERILMDWGQVPYSPTPRTHAGYRWLDTDPAAQAFHLRAEMGRWNLELWGDSKRCEASHCEVGITTNFRLPASPLLELLLDTSHSAPPSKDDVIDFIQNLVAPRAEEVFQDALQRSRP